MERLSGEGASWRWLRIAFLALSPTSDMPWTYEQATGKLIDPDGRVVGFGYSGKGAGKNNVLKQNVEYVGPIPVGLYTIGAPHDTVTHGPFVLPLTPAPENEMHGRTAFLIHGDSVVAPGTASTGCIIQARTVREDMARSLDKQLRVVSGVFTVESTETNA